MKIRATGVGVAMVATLAVSACSTPPAPETGGRLSVVAAFYPLAYALERVGGDDIAISTLTRPGAEPHDVELMPSQVRSVHDADLVVYQSDFQPAVDGVVAAVPDRAFDVVESANLQTTAEEETTDDHAGETPEEHAEHAGETTDDHAGETPEEHAEHAGETTDDHAGETPEEHAEHAEETTDGHSHDGVDPHFWLDPLRYAAVADALAARLAQLDPAHATAYEQRAAAFEAELKDLDTAFTTGLATCRSRQIVTGHAAFGYLAARYDLHQLPVTGLSPEVEPTFRSMRTAVDEVRSAKASSIYTEPLSSSTIADAIAAETGSTVRILDPVEGITSSSAGRTYLEVMAANLATLRIGQECT